MNDREEFEVGALIDRFRAAIQYEDRAAAQRLHDVLAGRTNGSDASSGHLQRLVAACSPLRRPRTRVGWTLALGTLLLLASGAAVAGSNILNLGKPVDIQSTAAYFPLSGFHRVSTNVQVHRMPELVFIAAQGPLYNSINAERWPVVKALQQFGTLSRVKAVERTCTTVNTRYVQGALGCSTPTFDLSQAHYASRYIRFSSKDIVRTSGLAPGAKVRLFQSLSPAETALFDRYARFKGQPYCSKKSSGHIEVRPCSKPIDYITSSLFPDSAHPTRTLPLIAIGHYIQTVSQDLNPADLAKTIGNVPTPGQIVYAGVDQGMPFDTVRQALATGKDPQGSLLVEHVNAEANIITALICHADGEKPASVCDRPVIKTILKSVK
jgi:hypothetical protein